jgi:hypothetical protein
VKLSLLSATSMVALAASAHAYVLVPVSVGPNLYDLVQDSDSTASTREPRTVATAALQATGGDRQDASFTGQVDQSAAAGTAFPLVPLGAARGTPPDDDFASRFAGTWRWNAWQKAIGIGVARIAPLIGTIGNGALPGGKPGSTVLIAQSRQAGLNGRSAFGDSQRSAAADVFAPSGTSTATMTVTGPANLRPRAGSGFSAAAANGAKPLPVTSEPTPAAASYPYVPQTGPVVNGNLVTANFSDAVTASGATTWIYKPIIPTASQRGPGTVRPNSVPPGDQVARLIDVTLPIGDQANATLADGTRAFLPASVSANPEATAARYLTSALNAGSAGLAGQTIEAFAIGFGNGSRTPAGAATDPLWEKIMAGVGPLDNSLALP